MHLLDDLADEGGCEENEGKRGDSGPGYYEGEALGGHDVAHHRLPSTSTPLSWSP